jgi:hypothetical protein
MTQVIPLSSIQTPMNDLFNSFNHFSSSNTNKELILSNILQDVSAIQQRTELYFPNMQFTWSVTNQNMAPNIHASYTLYNNPSDFSYLYDFRKDITTPVYHMKSLASYFPVEQRSSIQTMEKTWKESLANKREEIFPREKLMELDDIIELSVLWVKLFRWESADFRTVDQTYRILPVSQVDQNVNSRNNKRALLDSTYNIQYVMSMYKALGKTNTKSLLNGSSPGKRFSLSQFIFLQILKILQFKEPNVILVQQNSSVTSTTTYMLEQVLSTIHASLLQFANQEAVRKPILAKQGYRLIQLDLQSWWITYGPILWALGAYQTNFTVYGWYPHQVWKNQLEMIKQRRNQNEQRKMNQQEQREQEEEYEQRMKQIHATT